MLSSILPTTVAGQAMLAASCIALLALAIFWQRRQAVQYRRLHAAVDNMSQGFLLYDAQNRLVLRNRRYIEMYRLSPQIVKTGCSLHEVIRHRQETGLFVGDPDTYADKILTAMAKGERSENFVQGRDDRVVLARNIPRNA